MEVVMKRPTCRTCPFWDFDPVRDEGCMNTQPGSDWLAAPCRRYAPIHSELSQFQGVGRDDQADFLIREGAGRQAEWLNTGFDDWCGEHPDFAEYLRLRTPPQIPDDELR